VKNNIGVSVIMPSYLGDYELSGVNKKNKFIRAVNSFLKQTLVEKELIIISHGCEITNEIYDSLFKNNDQISLIKSPREPHITVGRLREMGRNITKYDWVTYLDSDDIILPNHLLGLYGTIKLIQNPNINSIFDSKYIIEAPENPSEDFLAYIQLDTSKYKDFYDKLNNYYDIDKAMFMSNISENGGINHCGTWQIAHKNNIDEKWGNSNKAEDYEFILRIKENNEWITRQGEYVVTHLTYNNKVIWDF